MGEWNQTSSNDGLIGIAEAAAQHAEERDGSSVAALGWGYLPRGIQSTEENLWELQGTLA